MACGARAPIRSAGRRINAMETEDESESDDQGRAREAEARDAADPRSAWGGRAGHDPGF
jgi:hypothetical protein